MHRHATVIHVYFTRLFIGLAYMPRLHQFQFGMLQAVLEHYHMWHATNGLVLHVYILQLSGNAINRGLASGFVAHLDTKRSSNGLVLIPIYFEEHNVIIVLAYGTKLHSRQTCR